MKKENICFHCPIQNQPSAPVGNHPLSGKIRAPWNLACIQKPPMTHGILNKHSEVQACVPASAHFLPSPECPSTRRTANTTVHNLQAPPERQRSWNSHRLGPPRQGRLTFLQSLRVVQPSGRRWWSLSRCASAPASQQGAKETGRGRFDGFIKYPALKIPSWAAALKRVVPWPQMAKRRGVPEAHALKSLVSSDTPLQTFPELFCIKTEWADNDKTSGHLAKHLSKKEKKAALLQTSRHRDDV